MSLVTNGEKCVVCKAYLFPEDDVVHCPHCGAPHHRECYNSIGHCGLEEYHNTENQYKKPEPKPEEQPKEEQQNNTGDTFNTVCRMCGESYPAEMPACPKCGTPDMSKMGGNFVMFDLLGGVPAETDLGDGVTADEAKMFVNSNTHRYIPKFLSFKHGKKASWNWLAFLTPAGWLISRKMYLLGAIIGALQIALTMLTIPFSNAIEPFRPETASYTEYANIIMNNISSIGWVSLIVAFLATSLTIGIHVIFGIFGDLIYKKRVISKVSEIKQANQDLLTECRKKGGVNLLLGIIVLYAVMLLPNILATFVGL